MGKRILILAAIGFPMGVLIAFLIALMGSGSEMHFFTETLLIRMGGNLSAATAVNILVCGLYGSACMVGTVFYDIERWPLALATVLHYLIVVLGCLDCFLLLGWGDGIRDYLITAGLQTAVFFLIWLIMYLRYKAQVKELNELNQKNKQR